MPETDNLMFSKSKRLDYDDFSLVSGGPLYNIFLKTHLSDSALELLPRRIIYLSLLCWLPLFILSIIDGHLYNTNGSVSFISDVDIHVRFLIVIPLLLAAELFAHKRMRFYAKQFIERNLIPENEMHRFNKAVLSAFRLRNSITAEILLVIIVYVIGVLVIWRKYASLQTNTWYSTSSTEGSEFYPAGLWYGYISLPLFQFLLIRWYYRLFIWIRFLVQTSRIHLRLVPMHPDRMGGLGFLTAAVYAFLPFVSAHGALLAGQIANRIFYERFVLLDFKVEISVMILFLLFVMLSPLLVFSAKLENAKRTGKREFSALAMKYVRDFDAKWIRNSSSSNEQLIGSSDIQSLADMANSYEVIKNMHFIPFSKEIVLQLVAAALVPMVPLALTMMPLGELMKKLIDLIF